MLLRNMLIDKQWRQIFLRSFLLVYFEFLSLAEMLTVIGVMAVDLY